MSKNNFNLLRFIFAGMVIISHAPELQDGNRSRELLTMAFGTVSFGELAVDSFFIISGFLITKSWTLNPDPVRYLKSRILRIYPGYLVASLICALVVGPLFGAGGYFQAFNPLKYASSAIFLQMPRIPPVFAGSPYPLVNGAMGTIFYEFCCYLLVLVLGMLGVYRKKLLVPLLGALLALFYIGGKTVPFELGSAMVFARLGMIFLLGSSFCLFEKAIPWKFHYAIFAIGTAVLFLFVGALAELAIGLLWGYAVLYFASYAKEFGAFNKLPDLSYGLYLYAWPVTKIIYWYWPHANLFACILATFVASIGLGAASWYGIEKPFMKMKYSKRKPAAVPQRPTAQVGP